MTNRNYLSFLSIWGIEHSGIFEVFNIVGKFSDAVGVITELVKRIVVAGTDRIDGPIDIDFPPQQ